MISQQALQEFKAIYEKEIGPAPDEQVLVALACDLLTLMDKTYRPIKKVWVENQKNKQGKKYETTMARGTSRQNT